LHVEEHPRDDYSHTIGYDAFITYICSLLARNSIVTISTSVSPLATARNFAREQLRQFVEVYLSCPNELRYQRLHQQEHLSLISDQVYEPPLAPELVLDTRHESAERSTLRILSYLEHHSYIAPLWDTIEEDEEDEIEAIKARLKALGYLE
jgi:adenylylsulfate kinase